VGNDGETLVADSSTSTGLRYTAGTVQSNPVLNSAMQVAQRGTSISVGAGAVYTLDRWMGFRSGAAAGETVSQQSTSDTTNLPFIQKCARVQRDLSNTSTAYISYSQSFESINSIPFAGKTITLSFYARKGANFSATSDVLVSNIYTGTGTDQTWVGGYTGFTTAITQNNTLTATWQRFTVTGSLASTITELAVALVATPTGTAGANDYFEVTGVQIDIGSVALPFRTYAGTIQGELAACQRYYQAFNAVNTYAIGMAYSGTAVAAPLQFVAQMRIAPTMVLAAAGSSAGQQAFVVNTYGTPGTVGTHAAMNISVNGFELRGTGYGASSFAAGNASLLVNQGGSSSIVYTASAEL
jgi:hypothetical protein